MRSVSAERAGIDLPIRFAVIAMGRLGGAEKSYSSDADVMFVFEPAEAAEPGSAAEAEATKLAQEVATRLRALLAAPSSIDPPLAVDADLRPEGRIGPAGQRALSPTGTTTRAGPRRGRRRRCCGPGSSRATPTWAGGSRR